MTARLFAIVGPSGVGKDTLMGMAREAVPDLRLARRVITRPASLGGEDFEGVDAAEFDRRLAAGEFALDWEAHGLRYAIPKAELAGPGVVLFNTSRAVLEAAAKAFPDLAVIHVTAPPEVLAARLAGRGRETPMDQVMRLARADFALPAGLDVRVVANDGPPEQTLRRFLIALQAESA